MNPTTLGERVAQLRKQKGLTQEKLAQRADISTPFVSDIENDKRNVSSKVLLKLSDALDVSLDYLMKGKEETERATDEPRNIPPELEKAADEGGWSYSDTVALLEAMQMVLARRGGSGDQEGKNPSDMTREEWAQLHASMIEG
jgi:transcriptional regulator with XRE-family HTH domain